MNKEELTAQGWQVAYSGACLISAWGKHMVHLYHTSGRRVNGYGSDEESAIQSASETIQKPLEKTHEIHH